MIYSQIFTIAVALICFAALSIWSVSQFLQIQALSTDLQRAQTRSDTYAAAIIKSPDMCGLPGVDFSTPKARDLAVAAAAAAQRDARTRLLNRTGGKLPKPEPGDFAAFVPGHVRDELRDELQAMRRDLDDTTPQQVSEGMRGTLTAPGANPAIIHRAALVTPFVRKQPPEHPDGGTLTTPGKLS